jgi:ribonuclease BN (tRNA processing enzyme)/CheY-like chemotaxis protein
VLDCGTGGHALGEDLMSAGAEGLRGHILISHTHWDHIQGIPFFAPLFVPGNEWDIYGPKGLGQSLREVLAGQMDYAYFPVTLDQCGANIRYHDLVEGTFEIDDIKVSTRYLNHPALTLGYRLEADGVTVVYACDHEPYSNILAEGEGEITGQDLQHARFITGADLLIHDAQYTGEEYPAKAGWGHSTLEYAVKLSNEAQVKRLALTHHDPSRDDDALDRLVASTKAKLRKNASPLEVFAAREGHALDLAHAHSKHFPGCVEGDFEAQTLVDDALTDLSVVIGIADVKTGAALLQAVQAEGIHAKFCSDADAARKLIAEDRPSLAILEHDPPSIDGLETCRAIRQQDKDPEHSMPVVIVASEQDQARGISAGVTDWLIKPFTSAYARTKVRAWALRSACKATRRLTPERQELRFAQRPLPVEPPRLRPKRARGARRPAPATGTENGRFSNGAISTEKAALLWMYCREVAPFETPSFRKKIGQLIAHATNTPAEM